MAGRLEVLRQRRQFLLVAAARRRCATRGLVVQAARRPAAEDGPVRVGFTVTRKVGNAVVRNRIRRRLRALAEELLPVAAVAGHDYVVIGRKAALHRRFDDLRDDFVRALRGVRLLRQSPASRPDGAHA